MTKSEGVFAADPSPLAVTFLLLSGASMMCVASAIDPLRAANRVAGATLFDWKLVSSDGEPPLTTAGLAVPVGGKFDPANETGMLAVIGGFGTREQANARLASAIRRGAGRARIVGGIEAGTWAVARAGLLEGRAATTHWEDMEDFASAFPGTDVRPDRYVIDGPVFTAGGASPTFDLMLHLVRARHGAALALDVASVFVYQGARDGHDAQPLVSLGRLDGTDPRLAQAVRLMETHLDNPLTIAAIAKRCGLSARALEMLFRRAIGASPGAYFLRLRLHAARRLVLDTRLSMAEIAARTGFGGAAAFSRAFSNGFGQAPSAMRRG